MAILNDMRVALMLGGGNALGAYQAGVYQALDAAGLMPDWIAGTSIGAINGAILAGNPPARRLERLAAMWRPAGPAPDWPTLPDGWRRTSEVLATMLSGRAGLFAPLGSAFGDPTPALYDTRPLRDALATLADFDRLNDGPVRYTAVAVDLDSGEEAAFDTRRGRITAEHVRASAALPPSYPAVAIDGRFYVDGGLAANLPLDPVLAEPGPAPLLAIAVDLLPAAAPRPRTLGEMAGRMQDLALACQSRRSIARWRAVYEGDRRPADAAVTLVRLAYADHEAEVAGKAMDFSPFSVRARWDCGLRDGAALVERLGAGAVLLGRPGLTVVE